MNALIAQAQRIAQLQRTNVENLYECDKKQVDDENRVRAARAPPRARPKDADPTRSGTTQSHERTMPNLHPSCRPSQAQLEFYRNRLVDSIEEKQRKSQEQNGLGKRGKTDASKAPDKRRRIGLAGPPPHERTNSATACAPSSTRTRAPRPCALAQAASPSRWSPIS